MPDQPSEGQNENPNPPPVDETGDDLPPDNPALILTKFKKAVRPSPEDDDPDNSNSNGP